MTVEASSVIDRGSPREISESREIGPWVALLRWLPWLVLGAFFVGLAIFTWRRSGDPFIDFGRELYTSWRLSEGDVLYRDVDSIMGPLSPYLNALWFEVFGASLTTLLVANLAMMALMTALVYVFFERCCNRLTAFTAAMVFLCVFGFAHVGRRGIFNFLTPYAHEATHGLVLVIAMVVCMSRYATRRSTWAAALAGMCLGAVFLTKPELFAAGAAAAAVGWAFMPADRAEGPLRARAILAFAAGALVPPVGFLFYFLGHMPAAEAVQAVGGAWAYLGASRAWEWTMYLWVSGLDEPWKNLAWMLLIGAAGFGLVGALARVDVVLESGGPRTRRYSRYAFLLLLCAAVLAALPWIPWLELARPVPLVALIVTVGLVVSVRTAPERAGRARLPLLMWSVVSLVLLAKIILKTRPFQYGFSLAVPGTLLAIACLVYAVPLWLERRFWGGATFRVGALLLVGVFAIVYFGRSATAFRQRDYSVGQAGDMLRTRSPSHRPEGVLAARALELIEERVPPNASLAVWPEGAALNYWSRRENPTPHIVLKPPELAALGVHSVLASLRTAPPDYVLVTDRPLEGYGFGRFGEDSSYAQPLLDWLRAEYRRLDSIEGTGPVRPDAISRIELYSHGKPRQKPGSHMGRRSTGRRVGNSDSAPRPSTAKSGFW